MPDTIDLGGYYSACGPATLAQLLRVSRSTAGDMLAEIVPPKGTFTRTSTMVQALDRAGLQVRAQPVAELEARRQTLASWVRQHPEGRWLILVTRHFVTVEHGQITQDNGVSSARKLVRYAGRVTDPNLPAQDHGPVWPLCKCGCGQVVRVGRYYKPGHDARHVSVLAALVRDGQLGVSAAQHQLAHSDALRDKLAARLSRLSITPSGLS